MRPYFRIQLKRLFVLAFRGQKTKVGFPPRKVRTKLLKGTEMAAEKKATKKPAVKKTVAVKPVAPKAAVKKAPAKKPAEKKNVVSQDKFYAMVSEAAYFAAQNDGNRKGSVEYWMDAEAAVRAKFDIA